MDFKAIRCRIPDLLHNIGQGTPWLCAKTGISRQRMSDYINLRYIMSLPTAVLIADTIGCAVDDIYVWVRRQK